MTLESTGSVTGPMAARKVRTYIKGGTSSASEKIIGGDFPTEVSFNTNWITEVLTQIQGSSGWDNNDSRTGTRGALEAVTNNTEDDWLQGYREQTLFSNIVPGTTITLSMWLKKDYVKVPQIQTLSVQLVYTDNTSVTPPSWSEVTISNANTWTSLSPATFTVPSGKTVNRVRFYFDIRNNATQNGKATIWFDEVSLTTGTGTIPVSIVNWQEIY